jgi:acetyl esterase/lipase
LRSFGSKEASQVRILATVTGLLLVAWTALLYIPIRWRPAGMFLFAPRMAAGSLSNAIAFLGAAISVFGLAKRSLLITAPATLATALATAAAIRMSRATADLDRVFGSNWETQIPPSRKSHMLQRRWNVRVPSAPDPLWQRDVPFATIPGSGRTLLCDIWQPPANVAPSGLGIIHLFGSAWYILDKDTGTRPFFRHLASQGHVIMDIAYRLYPETDIPGMVGDTKRAIAWLKEHAGEYGILPDRIVLVGGSAGAHLALLSAYAPQHPDLTPLELADTDLAVHGVVSIYGQADLTAMYYHTDQQNSTKPDDPKPVWDAPAPEWMIRLFGPDIRRLGLQKGAVAGRCDWLIGGTPEQVPDRYALQSPITHVHAGCPPTLLIHGTYDMMAPVEAMRAMHSKLVDAGVPVSIKILPHTDHAFDMLFWRWSPPAQSALYDIERFLTILALPESEQMAQAKHLTLPLQPTA